MNITGLTVSVGYGSLLEMGMAEWSWGTEGVVVVTTPEDALTLAVCKRYHEHAFTTRIFYANGAAFNKGAALAQAVAALRLRHAVRNLAGGKPAEWLLVFDADVVPPGGWRSVIERAQPQFGQIYGASRGLEDHGVVGFFMLFHVDDPHLPPYGEPLFDLFWPHAGNFDTTFVSRWPPEKRVMLPLTLKHHGPTRTNWFGRAYTERMAKALAKRNAGNAWETERMVNPPTLPVLP